MGLWPLVLAPVTVAAGLIHGPVTDPVTGQQIPGTPDTSTTMEAFMDTPIVNGCPYPFVPVGRKAYRFRILNANGDRALNLQLYFADTGAAAKTRKLLLQ